MKKAFTLIELVVAVALLAMVVSFAGVIFKASIDAHRTTGANAEIMRKLRAITDQLNADFRDIRKDAPLLIWFQQDNDPYDPNRYDQIMFFADGDFQSTQLYSGLYPADTGKPVIGNVARIYYGQAQSRDSRDNTMRNPFYLLEEDRLLARRRHILTADPYLDNWPSAGDVNGTFDDVHEERYKNELYEHDRLSLAQWKTVNRAAYNWPILNICFVFRPWVDMNDTDTFHKLMCEGVGSFAIQWAYWDDDDKEFYWYPSDDPDGSGTYSHFGLTQFGTFFNIPGSATITDWYPIEDAEYKPGDKFLSNFYPRALKFTFRLYDSKEIMKQGRTFTHIVYLEK